MRYYSYRRAFETYGINDDFVFVANGIGLYSVVNPQLNVEELDVERLI